MKEFILVLAFLPLHPSKGNALSTYAVSVKGALGEQQVVFVACSCSVMGWEPMCLCVGTYLLVVDPLDLIGGSIT